MVTNDSNPPIARVAMLVDCDNVSWKRAAAIVAEAASHGVLGVKRGYGDWGHPSLSAWREQLIPLAIQPVQQIAYVAGKGATDIALVIDAMDLLHSGHVDTFCLVASDSDYTRLAMRLREAGKRVVGMGERKTPTAFSSACDRFTFIEVLDDDGSADLLNGSTALTGSAADGQLAPAAYMAPESTATALPDLQKMLVTAVQACVDDSGWARLSTVGWHLVANHPAFDSRNYGYPRLGLLVGSQKYLEMKSVPSGNGNVVHHVRLRPQGRPFREPTV